MAKFSESVLTKKPERVNRLLYQQVMDTIESKVRTGNYIPGQKLPSMKELSRELGMSFLTIRRGLTALEQKGILNINHGSGTFVTEQPFIRRNLNTIRLGIAYRTYMLQTEQQHPIVGVFLAGAHRRCKPPEFILQPLFYNENQFVQEIGQTILSEQLSGIISTVSGLHDEDHEFLREHHVHVVTCSGSPRSDGWTLSVRTDNAAALRQAVDHLRTFGHTRIAFISYIHKESTFKNDNRYYAQLAFDHRLGNPAELMVLVGNTNMQTHWEDVEKFFKIDPLPTAVIVSDEFLADVVLDGCARRGINIPEQLSVVSLQDPKPEGHRIPLTTATSFEDLEHKAYKATDLLVKRIAGEPIESTEVVIPTQLLVKASSGPVKRE